MYLNLDGLSKGSVRYLKAKLLKIKYLSTFYTARLKSIGSTKIKFKSSVCFVIHNSYKCFKYILLIKKLVKHTKIKFLIAFLVFYFNQLDNQEVLGEIRSIQMQTPATVSKDDLHK